MKFFFLASNVEDINRLNDLKTPKELNLILNNRNLLSSLKEELKKNCLILNGTKLDDLEGNQIGLKVEITTPEQMHEILQSNFKESIKYVYIETGDWHIIPLENIIAKFQNSSHELMAYANNSSEIKLLENILEIGIPNIIFSDFRFLTPSQTVENNKKLDLREFKITAIDKIGIGDRVCVDTASLLKKGEGLLVGSSAQTTILVEAEVEESGFVNARPFRINAGVVASYVINMDKTNYLSELRAGSEVMVVNRDGSFRIESVARVKIERRPLIMLKVEHQGKEFPIVLQDAETVKIVNLQESISVTKLKIGDAVLGSISEAGRHFGMKVDETIQER